MKTKINYLAILTFYIIAITLRYITNKTGILDSVPNDFLKVVFQGAGPAVGAFVAFSAFHIKPTLSLKGNYPKITIPLLLYWGLPILLIGGVDYFLNGNISVSNILIILIYGLLEEIGWRGFLQQELKPLPEPLKIIMIAALWFIWHLNFDLSVSNLIFFGILLLGTWGIGKVADVTHSLIAVAAIHSLNNFFSEIKQTQLLIISALLAVWITALIIRKRQSRQYISDKKITEL